jgi:DNA end-binding protein Ku
MRDLAAHIIERKSAAFEPSQFEDRYENAVVELVRAKQTGEPVRIEEAPRPSNVVNLMEALRRSIAAEEPAGGPPKAPSKTSEERPVRKAKREPSSRKAGSGAKKAG